MQDFDIIEGIDNIDKIVRITDDTILSPEQQVAYCLWSQTFWGFSPEQQENELKFMIEDSKYQMKLGLTYTHQLTDDGDLDFVCGLSSDEEERATKQWEQWRRNCRFIRRSAGKKGSLCREWKRETKNRTKG